MITGKEYYQKLMSAANDAYKAEDLKKAIALYSQLTRDIPSASEPYHMLGIIASKNQKYDQAIPLFEKAIERMPQNPIYKNNLAEVFLRINRLEKAIELLKSAITIDKNFIQANIKLGSIYSRLGDWQKAENILKRSIEVKKDYQPGILALGTHYLKTGVFDKAKELLMAAIQLDQRSVESWNNLGATYQEIEEYNQAIECYEKAENLDTQKQEAIANLARLYSLMGHEEKARAYYLKWARIYGNHPLLKWKAKTICPSVFNSKEDILTYRSKVLDDLVELKKNPIEFEVSQLDVWDIYPPSDTIYHGQNQLPLSQSFDELFRTIPQIKQPKQSNDFIRLGIVLSPGHDGVFLRSMKGILNQMSSKEIETTVVCFSIKSEKNIRSEITNQKIRILRLSEELAKAAHLLSEEQFDLIYYWEIGTDALNYFLPYFRPGRVQCTGWGWPVTTGNSRMDYFISTENLDSEETKPHYSEKLLRLKKLPTYYYKPRIPELKKTLSDFGFDQDINLYFCSQNLKKVHPDFDSVLKGILEQDLKARIAFRADKFDYITNQLALRLKKMGKLFERIVFLPWLDTDDYYQLIQLAKVMLDTLHFNGVNTTYDALAAGTPVVSIEGKYFRDRYTYACYQQMGMEGPICHSVNEYIETAVDLANNDEKRRVIKRAILTNNHLLFEDQGAVLEFENTVLKIAGAKN